MLVAVLAGALTACASTSNELGCTSRYGPIFTAPTWSALEEALVDYPTSGQISSVRIRDRSTDPIAGKDPAVRVVGVVDLLDRHERRLEQVDVWRTPTGEWRAGRWNQCAD